MELTKKNLRMLKTKSEAMNQVTFDEDYNVPDACPDVGRMIQKKGEVRIEEVQINAGNAVIRGELIFHLLYVADDEAHRVHSLEGKIPIQETLYLEGLESGDKVCLKWEIEDLTLRLIHSRKLNIRALVTFRAFVEELEDVEIPVGLKDQEGVSAKEKELRALSLCVHKKDTMRRKEKLVLPSNKLNIHRILWSDVQLRGLDLKPEQEKVQVRGELFLFILYAGEEEENPLQWAEQAVPFVGEIACAGCSEELIPQIEAQLQQTGLEVQPDADGEERIIQADLVLVLDMKFYREEEFSLLQDVYTPKKSCIPVKKEHMVSSLLMRNDSKCRLQERVTVQGGQGKILQICHSGGEIRIDEAKVTDQGIRVEGIIQVRILYIITDDEMPFYSVEETVPFSHLIEAAGMDENCVYYLRTDLEQLSTNMADSSEIEVKAVVNLNAVVFRQQSEGIISGIKEGPLDRKKLEELPGIVCYMVQQGDTLWDVAKRFYTSLEEIRELNQMTDDQLKPGEPILVAKNAGVF